MHRMLRGLIIWTLLGAFIVGISAQTDVTKDDEGNLVFPPLPETCEYIVTEQLNQTPKSATFGNIATGVIRTIAPATFAQYVEVIRKTIDDPTEFTNNPSQYGTFFAGILILFILGLFLALLVPCIGCIFCCCRCCDNCGGRMLQKTEDNTLCKRWTFVIILVVISVLLGVGCASVYLGGKTLVDSAETIPSTILATADDLECYISESLTTEFGFLVNTSITAVVDLSFDEVNGISSKVEGLLQDAENAIDTVKSLDAVAKEINSSLNQAAALQDAEETVKMSLQTFVDSYSATLNSTACMGVPECNAARQNFDSTSLSLNSDVATVVDFSSIQSKLTDILAQNLTGKAEELRTQLEPIKEFIDDNNFDSSLIDFNSNDLLEITDGITNTVDETFAQVRSFFEGPEFTEVVDQISKYGFIGAAVFAGLIGTIVVIYILGIIFGEIGRNRDDDPTDRECMANCGGCLLVIGWVLSLLLYFIIAIFAATFFLFGSMGEKFICQPLAEPNNFQTIQELLTEVIPDAANFSSFNFSTALRNCEQNQGIWAALELDDAFGNDIDEVLSNFENELNVTSILGDFNFDETVEFDVNPLKNLTNLNFTVINFDLLQAELNKSFPSLDQQIEKIANLSSQLPPGDLQDELNNHSEELTRIQDEELEPLQNQVKNLSMELPDLEQKITALQNDASQLVTDVETLLQDAETTLKDVDALIPKITDIVTQTLDHAKMEIKTNLGSCRPLYNLYDSVDYIMCDNFFDSLNSIWLGFGIAVVFFIFGVIFAVKLSKFYRRMNEADNYHQEVANTYGGGHPNGDPYAGKNYPV